MTSFAKDLQHRDQLEACIVHHFRECVRGAMLERIVCFGADPIFIALSESLSTELDISLKEAGSLLWPTSHAIYKAAEGVGYE